MTETVNSVFGPHHEFTKLIPKLEGDPEDAFSSVPYEKVSYFIYDDDNEIKLKSLNVNKFVLFQLFITKMDKFGF